MSSIPDCEWPEENDEEHDFTELAKLMSAAVGTNTATEKKVPIVETKVASKTEKPPAPIKFGRRKVLTSR